MSQQPTYAQKHLPPFHFGIEHEVAFLNRKQQFADFTQTTFADFDQIIRELPLYPNDYPQLRVGDAGIKHKRWYIEGYERFKDSESVIDCPPKGIEIRTTKHRYIQGVLAELHESFARLRQTAVFFGYTPVCISYNPFQTTFEPYPPLTSYEIKRRQASPERQTAEIHMLTYGPDLSLSLAGLSTDELIDIGRKLTFYSPYIVPFSFSSPFHNGALWGGLSMRTFVRTGVRPAVLVHVDCAENVIKSNPSLTQVAQIEGEIGRIEFKAFDTCDDFSLYAALLALLKGLILDKSLAGRITTPDTHLHQLAAKYGFQNSAIYVHATKLLIAAEMALSGDPDAMLLTPLHNQLRQRKTPAHKLIEAYQTAVSIEDALRGTYHQQTDDLRLNHCLTL